MNGDALDRPAIVDGDGASVKTSGVGLHGLFTRGGEEVV
jgi:hypothetical protein